MVNSEHKHTRYKHKVFEPVLEYLRIQCYNDSFKTLRFGTDKQKQKKCLTFVKP